MAALTDKSQHKAAATDWVLLLSLTPCQAHKATAASKAKSPFKRRPQTKRPTG
jgi:hypothetical protein